MYLKLTNTTETHFGLQYHDGLNIDPLPFAKEGSCCPGGIYFTTLEWVHRFIRGKEYIREVTIPEDAEMVEDPSGGKWRASKVILGTRKQINNVETWKWLVECGADVHVLEWALIYSSEIGNLEIVKYLIEHGVDIHVWNDCALRCAYAHLEVIKYLVKNGADIHANNDAVLQDAICVGNLGIVKWLVEHGANINFCDATRYCKQTWRWELLEYLKEQAKE
jgi:hypothetical protein